MTSYGDWVKEGEAELAAMRAPTREEDAALALELDRENAAQAEREEAEMAEEEARHQAAKDRDREPDRWPSGGRAAPAPDRTHPPVWASRQEGDGPQRTPDRTHAQGEPGF